MTITAAKPDQEIDLRLEFLAPMKATNRAVFTLAPVADAVRVTWRMEGTDGFAGKAFALFMNMDKMVGGNFEKGLTALKFLAQADAEKRTASGFAPARPRMGHCEPEACVGWLHSSWGSQGVMTHEGTTAREATEMVARQSYGKLVALLSSRTRNVTWAEDALSDAFAAALSIGLPAGFQGTQRRGS